MSAAATREEVVDFRCGDARLWGILARPAAAGAADIAVLIVVGGPQYRVGSHRQFVLLARRLAAAGFPALRFDLTGMGDSEGELRPFDASGPDVRAALDALLRACPGVRRVVIWGLCDAASAALMFGTEDPRVAGIVAANPWARSAETLAVAQLKHYYVARLLERDFWRKLLGGGLDWRASFRSLAGNLAGARRHGRRERAGGPRDRSFQAVMARGLARFRGPLLLVLSGNDITAREFIEYAASSPAWKGLLDDPRVTRVELPRADHTFSDRGWQDRVESETIAWLERLATTTPTRG